MKITQDMPLLQGLVSLDAEVFRGLAEGDAVSIKVLENLGSNLWRISVGGKVVVARSLADLQAGATREARVIWNGNLLQLSINHSQSQIESIISSAGLPLDTYSWISLSALLSEGLAATPALLAKIRRSVLADPRNAVLRSELAAAFAARDCEADGQFFEGVVAIAQGDLSGGHGNASRQHGHNETATHRDEFLGENPSVTDDDTVKNEQKSRETGSHQRGSEAINVDVLSTIFEAGSIELEAKGLLGYPVSAQDGVVEADLSEPIEEGKDFIDALKKMLAGESADWNGLSWFNSIKSRGAQRSLIPFHFTLDSIEFRGSLSVILHDPVTNLGRIKMHAWVGKAQLGSEKKYWQCETTFVDSPRQSELPTSQDADLDTAHALPRKVSSVTISVADKKRTGKARAKLNLLQKWLSREQQQVDVKMAGSQDYRQVKGLDIRA